MADTSLFKRLGRLFSSDVVIRNIGGDQLKVADVNQIQTTGRYQTNSLIDVRDARGSVPRSSGSPAAQSQPARSASRCGR